MKNIKSTLLLVLVCLVVGGLGGFLLAPSPASQNFQAAGDTSSSAKIAQVVLDLSTTTPTSVGGACKLYNSDARSRVIDSVSFYLDGLTSMTGSAGTGVASTTWALGTSTAADIYTAAGGKVLSTTIATSTANGAIAGRLYVASTTPGATATFVNREWASGTCLNLFTNATSSGATMNGILRINYSQGAN